MQSEFLTLSEVAALLKLGERTTYDLARQGRLVGAAKIGRQWRVGKKALEAWLREGGEATFGEKRSA